MSVARHHAEWLSLVDISGPFLSLPVLMRVFPQQLDTLDADLARDTRLAFSESEDAEGDRAVHHAWLQFVLGRVLRFPDEVLLSDQALPPGLEFAVVEHGETLRPQWAVKRTEDERPAMLIASYPPGQALDHPTAGARWRTASPATRMMTLLQGTGISLGLVTNGTDWMLVSTRPGEASTYVTWDAQLWSEEPLTLRAFCSLLGARRAFGVAESDRLPALLVESAQNQQEVTDQLGSQVRKAVEVLVQDIDRINIDRQGRLLHGIDEKQLYQAALTVMMRLVFVFSAEERGLLLLGDPLWNRHYAISTLRDQLREVPDENLLNYRHDAWSRLLATFRAIYAGVEHDQMRLPAYGGALFDPDRFPFLEGRAAGTRWQDVPAQPLPINNRAVLHLLEALQFLEMRLPGGGSEPRRLSFRALDIEQIGHVYEGLLDHTARRAESTVLGLRGSGGDDAEVELATLEAKAVEGQAALVELLKELTGRQPAALKRELNRGEPPSTLALQTVCAGHQGLYARLVPFAHLLRKDSSGQPVVIHAGSIYVTKGTDRRSSGTHYTPRALTEPVVKTTLDPLLYEGVSEGVEPSAETLKSPADILALKVCDPACGSGAFLVQACRYLAERVVEGWARAEGRIPTRADGLPTPLTVPEAIPIGAGHSQQLLPNEPEERLALARRLVAERCLYGVDVNPMAVEMAKLSLWLVTLHKHRPFTFLDHAIKCGDSLLGLHDQAQLERFHLVPSRGQMRVVDYLLKELGDLLAHARGKREALERFTALDVRDAELKAQLHREAETSLVRVRLLGDILVGAALSTARSNNERSEALLDARLEELLLQVGTVLASDSARAERPTEADAGVQSLHEAAARMLTKAGSDGAPRRPFHWVIEFPEVFTAPPSGGFDALIGNPPFAGGQKITGPFGEEYRDYLVLYLAEGRRGSADLCAYFFLRAAMVLKPAGTFGLLAVNTIAEGDTRQVGLEAMLRTGVNLFAASPNFQWPGDAAVVASSVHGTKKTWTGKRLLSGRVVAFISAYLTAEDDWSPKPLLANAGKSFQGSTILGLGFTMSPDEAKAHIARDARNTQVLLPYIGGEDLNGSPDQTASRWVICFWDWPLNRSVVEGTWESADERQREQWLRGGAVPKDYPGQVAEDFSELLDVVRRLVKPERDRKGRDVNQQKWWHFERARPALYHAIGRGRTFARHPKGWTGDEDKERTVVAIARHSKGAAFLPIASACIFSEATVVLALPNMSQLAVLVSSIHVAYAWLQASKLKVDLRYSPSDAFEPFPFPEKPAFDDRLAEVARAFCEARAFVCTKRGLGVSDVLALMNDASCNDGDVVSLRTALQEVDVAVRDAYGWTDVSLDHRFHEVAYLPPQDRQRFTISEVARLECLRRLAALNRQRWQDEQSTKASEGPKTRAAQGGRTPLPKGRVVAVSAQSDMFD
jgi:hypothetical protein